MASHYRGGNRAAGSGFIWNNDWKLGKAAVISWMNSPVHRATCLLLAGGNEQSQTAKKRRYTSRRNPKASMKKMTGALPKSG